MIQGIIHIHQGGTIRAYCGIRLNGQYSFVAWEDAAEATCSGCAAHFGPQS